MANIRSYALPRLPRKWIMREIQKYICHDPEVHWEQSIVEEGELREWLLSRCSTITKIKNRGKSSVVLHQLKTNVDQHTDGMSASVLLIPLKTSKTVKLEVEYDQATIKGNRVYRFNDSLSHGILNPHYTKCLFFTVDFDG